MTCSQGREDPFRGLVRHGPVHRPSGGDVGHRQGEAELAGSRCRPRGRPDRSRRIPGPRRPTRPRSGSGSGTSAACRAWCGTGPAGTVSPVRAASLRSIVAALMRISSSACASVMSSSPSRRSNGTSTGSIGASSLPAGARSTAQHITSAVAARRAPYTGVRRRRTGTHRRAAPKRMPQSPPGMSPGASPSAPPAHPGSAPSPARLPGPAYDPGLDAT